MYRYTFFSILWLLSSSAWADPCEMDLDTLLQRYVEARGGAEALESQRALRLKSTNHEGKWNPKFDYRVMKPGYMWIEAEYDDGEIIIEGFDGERGWEKWPNKPAEYVSGAAGSALNQGAQSPVHLYGLHHMQALGADVSFRGCETLDDSSFYVINVRSAFGSDLDYYLNQDTYLLERSRTQRALHPTVDPTPITIEEYWTDFRDVEGVLHPFGYSLTNVKTAERLSWLEVHSIARDAEARPESFQKPE